MLQKLSLEYMVTGLSGTSRQEGVVPCDLRNRDEVKSILDRVCPDIVVHTAAYRDPDYCEDHPDEIRQLNVGSTESFIELLPKETTFVFCSSDYVFSGENPPYHEDDARSPVNEYGRSKVEAEDLLFARDNALILRFPLLVGAADALFSSGFIGVIMRCLVEQKETVFDDVSIRYPTWTGDVAAACAYLLRERQRGVFHISGQEGATQYDFYKQAASVLGYSAADGVPSSILAKKRAIRPKNSHLSNEKLLNIGCPAPHSFTEILRNVLKDFDWRNDA